MTSTHSPQDLLSVCLCVLLRLCDCLYCLCGFWPKLVWCCVVGKVGWLLFKSFFKGSGWDRTRSLNHVFGLRSKLSTKTEPNGVPTDLTRSILSLFGIFLTPRHINLLLQVVSRIGKKYLIDSWFCLGVQLWHHLCYIWKIMSRALITESILEILN